MKETPRGGLLSNLGALYGASATAEIENRVYKSLVIDADTGEFVRMDMRIVK